MTQVAPSPPRQKVKRLESETHRRWVARHACIVFAQRIADPAPAAISQAAHATYLGAKHGRPRGLGQKVDDIWIVPLCWQCHHEQTNWPDGEEAWWKAKGIDPEPICLALAEMSPDPKVKEAVQPFLSQSVEKVS